MTADGDADADADADVTDLRVSGPASHLYQLMWNRRSLAGLAVTGAAEAVARWRAVVAVRWVE